MDLSKARSTVIENNNSPEDLFTIICASRRLNSEFAA